MARGGAATVRSLVRALHAREFDPLRSLIDAYLLERPRAPERHSTEPLDMKPRPRPGGRLSPSSLCGCERQAVMKFVGIKGRRRIDPDTELIFEDGNWRHHKWQALFRDMETVLGRERFRVLAIERPVAFRQLFIKGHLDAILWLKPIPAKPGRKWVVDIKGINDMGFEYIGRHGPLRHHVQQVCAYCRAAGVVRGLLLYENKNNNRTRVYTINYEDESWKEVESWCYSVMSYLQNRHLPPRHPECSPGDNFFHASCPYARICYDTEPLDLRQRVFANFEGLKS